MPTLAKWLLGVSAALLLGLIIYPVLVPTYSGHRHHCITNTKQLGIAVIIYTTDYDDRFPPSESWAESIEGYVKNPDIFRCPNGDWSGGYAFNANLDRINSKILVPQSQRL